MKSLKVENVKSSERELEEFLNSNIWTDMKEEISAWREGLRDLLENGETDEGRHVGRADACKYFLSLPEVILLDIRLSKEDRNGTSSESEGNE